MKNSSPSIIYSLSAEETFQFGKSLGSKLKGGELIVLEGELGMGKTVLAKGIASGLSIDPDEVCSPSFLIVNQHEGRLKLFHIDLYRIKNEEEIEEIGIRDILEIGGVVVVEWGEKLPRFYRKGAITIRISDMSHDSRKILIS